MKKKLSLALLLLLCACESDEQSYCDNVGDCSNKGSSDWIASCNDETSALETEAHAVGCGPQVDAYYACTNENFTCDGITSSFPGCDDDRAALDACIAAAQSGTACDELTQATSACPGAQPDAGAASCDASRDCQARCYLDNVPSPCAPTAAQIQAVTSCASACP